MSLFDIPGHVLSSIFAGIALFLSILNGWKQFRSQRREDECASRAEMQLKFDLRDEQIRTLQISCIDLKDRTQAVESKTDKRLDELLSQMTGLRVDFAKLAASIGNKERCT